MSLGRFTTQLGIKVIGAQTYEVIAPLVYENLDKRITVKEGFDFDGASVPQWLWGFGLSPMTGGYQKAACLHDALYASEYFDRKTCDELFLQAMEADQVNKTKRYLMYVAVRAAGWYVWWKHDKNEVALYKEKYVEVS